jgi:hypothetical protein
VSELAALLGERPLYMVQPATAGTAISIPPNEKQQGMRMP